MTLRDYQQDLFDRIHSALRRGVRTPLVVSATGSGKTALFCYIAHRAERAGSPVVILVHRRELITQTSATLTRFGVPHGIIQPGITGDPSKLVQLAMVQTIARRIDRISTPKLIIVDESHHAVAGQYRTIIKAFPSASVIGFTATPLRLDGKGLGDYFAEIIPGPSVEWLMTNGHLCRPRYFAPPMKANMKGIKKRMGDYSADQLADAMTSAKITGDAVAHYNKLTPGTRAVAFCVNIRHAEHVAGMFNADGIRAGIIKGDMSGDERRKIVQDLADGIVRVMVSVDVVSEGFDLPSVETAILLRPTQSLGLYLQQIGRILRPSAGKTATILDHAGNIAKHGLAEYDREWSLDGQAAAKKKAEASTHRQCDGCYAMYPKILPACSECGWTPPPPPDKEFEHSDEELVEIRRTPLQLLLSECKTREDLKRIAKAKGYKPGFVYYKAKQLNIR
jgi:superfamily II DNA or RNA helicase